MSIPTNQGTSNTYTFAPSTTDMVLYAFSLCNIPRSELQEMHFVDAAMAFNFAMVNLSNYVPLQWTLSSNSIPLVAGTSVYNLPNNTIPVPIVTILTGNGQSQVERVIGPLSAYEYAAMPTKETPGPPTSYFYSKLTPTPTLTLWPVPDVSNTYTAVVQYYRQLQDVDPQSPDQGADIPYRFLDYIQTEVAARLADSYQPAKAQQLYMQANTRLWTAINRDHEDVPITISPALSGYYHIL